MGFGLPESSVLALRKKVAKSIETHSWSASIYNRVQIHLQYLPDVVPLARAWDHTGLSDGGEPLPALPVRLQEFSKSLAHRSRKSELLQSPNVRLKLYNPAHYASLSGYKARAV